MKKIVVILACCVLFLSSCGKKEEKKQTAKSADTSVQTVTSSNTENYVIPAYETDEFYKDINGDSKLFVKAFQKFDDTQKYYFCSAFAMGAMSVAKPITASAMVNYFMGLGVAKYQVGIDDHTYPAFNAGKNSFHYESIVNTILNDKICEDIMDDAADFAKKQNYNVADLDKMGNKEVEKIIERIQNSK
ncbi:MAG: hypothetical protein ILA52_01590 [Alphaproteobacteria bacterium]|nr:hypothetical protein [Alphaproteobacteria bacterium]